MAEMTLVERRRFENQAQDAFADWADRMMVSTPIDDWGFELKHLLETWHDRDGVLFTDESYARLQTWMADRQESAWRAEIPLGLADPAPATHDTPDVAEIPVSGSVSDEQGMPFFDPIFDRTLDEAGLNDKSTRIDEEEEPATALEEPAQTFEDFRPSVVIFSMQEAEALGLENERHEIERLRAEGVIVPVEPSVFELGLDGLLTLTGLKFAGSFLRGLGGFLGRKLLAPLARFALRKGPPLVKRGVLLGRIAANRAARRLRALKQAATLKARLLKEAVTAKTRALKRAAIAKARRLALTSRSALAQARDAVNGARRRLREAVDAGRRRLRRLFGFGDEAAKGGDNVAAGADEIVERVGRLPPRPAGRAPWQSTQTGNTSKNARRLKNSLGSRIADDEQAHHIVASTHGRAQPARDLLDHFEIDINGAENGVGLARPVHEGTGLHTH